MNDTCEIQPKYELRSVVGVACSARDQEDETCWVRVPAAFCSSCNILGQDTNTNWLRSTQPFIPPAPISRVPVTGGAIAGTSPLPGGW